MVRACLVLFLLLAAIAAACVFGSWKGAASRSVARRLGVRGQRATVVSLAAARPPGRPRGADTHPESSNASRSSSSRFGGASEAVTGWGASVGWRVQRDSEPQRPAELRRVPASPSVVQQVDLQQQWNRVAGQDKQPGTVRLPAPQGVNITPFCVEQGTGWVMLRNASASPARVTVSIASERHRTITSRDRAVGKGAEVFWDARPAFLSPAPTAGPPFHVAWNYVAVGFGYAALSPGPEVVYMQTMVDQSWDCSHTWNGQCCTASGQAAGCYADFAWALHSSLGPLLPAHDFLKQPPGSGNGTVVCHPWGVVAASHVMDATKGTQVAPRRCKKPRGMSPALMRSKWMQHRCRPAQSRRVARWTHLRLLRQSMARSYGMREVGPVRGRSSPFLALIARRGTRRFVTLPEMVDLAWRGQFNVSLVYLEDIPLQWQLALLAAADTVAGVHGSSHMWVLFAPPGVTWAEFAPGYTTAPKLSVTHRHIGVNQQGRGTYPALAAYSGANHLGWTEPIHVGGRSAGMWKSANVTVPADVWVRVLNVSRALWQGLSVCPNGGSDCDVNV
eukprot:TRINITY_DN37415_c0_g1_i2.p1 TRINITY_DN37415_c0_g1~~TRINITY_DN37415_c0_g1_i2.p1  ORF type:complete len:561 (+),score=88.81 TRINITY_DN37415_c0_g1_i2:131-1813(+)